MKLKDLPTIELNKFLNSSVLRLFKDTAQKLEIEKVNYIVERLEQFFRNELWGRLTTIEIENIFEDGLNRNFGVYKKISVQTIKEWVYKYRQQLVFKEKSEKVKNAKEKFILETPALNNTDHVPARACVLLSTMRINGFKDQAALKKFGQYHIAVEGQKTLMPVVIEMLRDGMPEQKIINILQSCK